MQDSTMATVNERDSRSVPCSAPFTGSSLPVSLAKVGQSGKVVRISGNAEVKKFLSDIGFTTGVEIKVVSDLNGSKILSIRGSKIAVDGKMASKIMFNPE